MAAAFRDFFHTTGDGLRLHARVHGDEQPGQLPVVCLPGLTRNGRDFSALAEFLSQEWKVKRQVVAVDYRGRGRSGYDPDWRNYTVGTELADLLTVLEALRIPEAYFIGTSRGGLITQVLGAVRRDLIAAAVLNDIGPAIETDGLAIIRSYLEKPVAVADIDQAIALQKKIHGADFPALGEADWTRMVEALFRFEGGRPVPDYDPALVKTLAAGDPAKPLPTLWAEFDRLAEKPVLAIRGGNSKLLSEETLAEMARRSPRVETITVEEQGHAPFLETGNLPETIARFLDRAQSGA